MSSKVVYNPPKKEKKKFFSRNVKRDILTILVLIVGAVILCAFLAFVQNRTAEYLQHDNSVKILNEVTNTLATNDKTTAAIEEEFNSLNQSTIETLASYLNYRSILAPLAEASGEGDEAYEEAEERFSNEFAEVASQINCGNLYLVRDDGYVVICSDSSYNDLMLTDVMNKEELACITRYSPDDSSNGTRYRDLEGNTVYTPVILGGYYTYSTRLLNYNGYDFFLVESQSSDILNVELSGIKSIASVLKGVTVGKNGFLFAVNSDNDQFLYFNDGKQDLSGESYLEYGMTKDVTTDQYAGYQTINGIQYYCVSKNYSSKTFGNYTVVVAAVSRDNLLTKNASVVVAACTAFIVVAAVVAAYGMILRRDVIDRMIYHENKVRDDLKDEMSDGKYTLTDEEIEERVDISLKDAIDHGRDSSFKRLNIGTRDRKNEQHYFSTHIFFKQIPLIVVGLVLVFIISYFSQTLLALEDVTSTSKSRMNDIQAVLESNKETADTVKEYLNQQFLSKAILIRNILQEVSSEVLNSSAGGNDIHVLSTTDDNGNKEYLRDEYGNLIVSTGNSSVMQQICDANNIKNIYLYDDMGHVIMTSSDMWYYQLPRDETDPESAFYDIIDGKVDYIIQTKTESDDQLIGVYFDYYTQNINGETVFVSKSDYELQENGEYDGEGIIKHRGVMQIEVSNESFSTLTEITSLNYILSGMHVYGSDSFFVAMDTSDEHRIVYSPYSSSIGKTAEELGFNPGNYNETTMYNGFQTVNGVKYYTSMSLVGDYFISTVVPVNSIYSARDTVSLITVIFAAIFIIAASILYSLSSDAADESYKQWVLDNKKQNPGKAFFVISTPTGKKNTSAANMRFSTIPWAERSPDQKLSTVIMFYLTIALVIFIILLIQIKISGNSDSILAYIFSSSWERGFNIFSITESIIIMVMIIVITQLVQLCVRSFFGMLGARVETTGDLLVSVLKYAGVIGCFFYCLYLFGFDTTSLLASAGILSIVIGLGAQSLISDIIAGIFMVFEGEFQVGDIVTINDFRGQVMEIGLRTTKIMDISKNIKIFNNSSISGVVNMTQEKSFVVIDVCIPYGDNLERVENILREGFPKIRKKLPDIIDGPFYKGVSALDDSAVKLKITAACNEKDTPQLQRDLYREIYLLFNSKNVSIPFPQLTISYLDEDQGDSATKKEKDAAEKFVAEQKEKSKGTEEI